MNYKQLIQKCIAGHIEWSSMVNEILHDIEKIIKQEIIS